MKLWVIARITGRLPWTAATSRSVRCHRTRVATAANGSNCLAMLVRRDGECLSVLLERADKTIGLAWLNDTFVEEVNNDESDLL